MLSHVYGLLWRRFLDARRGKNMVLAGWTCTAANNNPYAKEVTAMRNDMARVTRVRPAGPRALRVRFAGEGREHELDLTRLLERKHFASLGDDPSAFAKARIVDGGLGLAWPIKTKWGRLDVSASTLQRIAEES